MAPFSIKENFMRCVEINGEKIEYTLVRKAVKNINLTVKTDGSVIVSAPRGVAAYVIDQLVISKADAILRMRKRVSDNINQHTVNGAKICIFEKEYTVLIVEDKRNYSKIVEDTFEIHQNDVNDQELTEKIIEKYVKDECIKVFTSITEQLCPLLYEYGVKMPEIKVRKMKTRWGSCMPYKQVITLNLTLAYKPLCCTEYVVLHELCHLVHPNHSKKFYALIQKYMPDYKQRKDLLKSN